MKPRLINQKPDPWEQRLAELMEFKKIHGHYCPPTSMKKLWNWVMQQRRLKNRGLLNSIRENRLNRIGFSWDPLSEIWGKRFAELVAFKRKHGHTFPSQQTALGKWVRMQRYLKTHNKLDNEREYRLKSIGFPWNQYDETWEEYFSVLLDYKKKHGHSNPPKHEPVIGEWASRQRHLKSKGRLSSKRQRRLESVNFLWSLTDEAWNKRFLDLVAFKKKHGHCNPPQGLSALGKWVSAQRELKAKGLLDSERAKQLEKLKFSWRPLAQAWEERFSELTKFKNRYGHCNPPPRFKTLYIWVGTQRNLKSEGVLEPDRESRLNSIGFSWNVLDDAWNTHFAELVAYKKKRGHCCPPNRMASLGSWVGNQRQLKAIGKLEPEREQRLNEIGFSWKPLDETWEKQFAELVKFKNKNGHCNPHQKKTSALGKWVSVQRYKKANGLLELDREQRLQELGISWNMPDKAWEHRFSELVAFKKKRGYIPFHHPANKYWAYTQRCLKTSGKLDGERMRRLNEIGFLWKFETNPNNEHELVNQFLEYHHKYGDFAIPNRFPYIKLYQAMRVNIPMLQNDPRFKTLLMPLGFPLNDDDLEWEYKFSSIKSFKKRYGHLKLKSGSELHNWLAEQLHSMNDGNLYLDREKRLKQVISSS